MNVVERNELYLNGILQGEGLFPHLEAAPAGGFFNWDFGLVELPREAGIIVIRGPRQYGKSTWLEYQLRETLRQFGPGTALSSSRVAHRPRVRRCLKLGRSRNTYFKRLRIGSTENAR